MDIIQLKKKLERYLKGTATETEKAVVEAWYKSYQADEAKVIDEVDKEAIKNAIRQGVNAGINPPAKIRRINYLSIAASLLLLLGVAFFYYRNQKQSSATYTAMQTKAGEVKQIVLPDSSVMWVNSLSRVRIPADFDSEIRQVLLDEGEAFFEVKHNDDKPFRVTTGLLEVQVLGTSFNVNAYKNISSTKVAVATGKVAVIAEGKTLTFLTPGQELVFDNQTHAYAQHKIDISESRSWRDGDTYLKQADFNELAVVVKNLYGIKLKPATPVILKYQFTMRLQRHVPADEALKAISLMHNNHYRKEGDQVILY